MKKKQVPKLLSPIKSFKGAIKVIEAGADELYCGVTIPELKNFSLYRGSSFNISNYEELSQTVKYAHEHNVSVSLTLNEPFMGKIVEKSVQKHVRACLEKEVDSIIVGDIGILNVIRNIDVKIPIYASTYLASMNNETTEFLRKQGFSRVILERHLTIPEISEMAEHSKIDLEIFIHGAGCSNINVDCYLFHFAIPNMMQAFLSIDGLKFPCALPFEIYDIDDKTKMLGKLPILDAYTFCTLCKLPELMKIGISGFKIEGRGFNDEYQRQTTKIYRDFIDLLTNGREENFQKNLELSKKMFTPLPKDMPLHNLEELCCEQKRCFYSDLFHTPYKYPVSWRTWTKHQLKYIQIPTEERKE